MSQTAKLKTYKTKTSAFFKVAIAFCFITKKKNE